MSTIAIQLLVQVILILINAFFAATEIAVISLNANKLRMLEESGDKLAPRLLKMLEQPAGFLSTIQIGITLAGFLGSAFAADSFSEYLVRWICEDLGFTALPISVVDTFSVVVITLILSYFTLIFGELVPKRIAMQKSLEMARLSCRVVSTLAFIARPVVALLSLSTNGVLRLLRMKTEDEEEQVTEDEIRTRSAPVSITMVFSFTAQMVPMMPPMVVIWSPTDSSERILAASFFFLFSGRISRK